MAVAAGAVKQVQSQVAGMPRSTTPRGSGSRSEHWRDVVRDGSNGQLGRLMLLGRPVTVLVRLA